MPDIEFDSSPLYLRNDPVDKLPFPKLVYELKYMGIKTIGEFKDNYDEIIKRILKRFPYFFKKNFTQDDVEEHLGACEN